MQNLLDDFATNLAGIDITDVEELPGLDVELDVAVSVLEHSDLYDGYGGFTDAIEQLVEKNYLNEQANELADALVTLIRQSTYDTQTPQLLKDAQGARDDLVELILHRANAPGI